MYNRGGSDLIKAIRAMDSVECRRLLEPEDKDYHVANVIDIHEKDVRYGWSPIIWASMYGRNDIVELLLSKGANIHDKSSDGMSPILFASQEDHTHIVVQLMSKGASIHDIDDNGDSCFSYALNRRNNGLPCGLLYRLRKWPTTMAIIMLQEMKVINIIDFESVIDLHQFLGRPDDCSKSDSEEDYKRDVDGNFPQ